MLGVLEQGYGVMGVRRARPGDMDTVLRLVSDFRARCGAEVAYEPEVFVSFVRENLDDDDFLILLLDGDQGLLIGCITDTVYSSARIAKELLWYTRPEARGRGMALMRTFELWARQRGALDLYCSLRERHPVMHRLGFVPLDVGYTKRLRSWRRSGRVAAHLH